MPYLLCRRLGRQLSATLSEDNEDAHKDHPFFMSSSFDVVIDYLSIFFSRALGIAHSRCPFVCVDAAVWTTTRTHAIQDYDISTPILTRGFQTIYNRRNSGEKGAR